MFPLARAAPCGQTFECFIHDPTALLLIGLFSWRRVAGVRTLAYPPTQNTSPDPSFALPYPAGPAPKPDSLSHTTCPPWPPCNPKSWKSWPPSLQPKTLNPPKPESSSCSPALPEHQWRCGQQLFGFWAQGNQKKAAEQRGTLNVLVHDVALLGRSCSRLLRSRCKYPPSSSFPKHP